MQAELLGSLDVLRIQAGKTFFARVTLEWKGQGCVLRKGSILQGTVEAATSRQGKGESKLSVSFRQAQCNGKEMQPMSFVLTVVAREPADWSAVPGSQYRMQLAFTNLRTTGGDSSQFRAAEPHPGMPVFGNFPAAYLEVSGTDHQFPVRPGIRPGDVLDFKGIKLDPGAGPNLSSVFSSRTRNIFLDQYTQFLLVPASSAFRLPSASPGSFSLAPKSGAPAGPAAGAAMATAAAPVNDIEVCAPPGCAVDLPVTAKELEGPKAGSLPLRPLGYEPRSNKVRAGFEDEESLVWLGPGELLFTFNPHRLIRRGPELNDRTIARVIRAVVVDTASRNVVRTVDWEITDARPYLWPIHGGRILVHVGNELRVYGAGLEMERTIPLAGPLAFVRIAPNGALMAVATLRERHSPELHRKLHTELGVEPEEDVEIEILNQEFNTVARATTVTSLKPPTLLNGGQVKLLAQPGQWYRLAMNTWENHAVSLARFHSVCAPELTSSAPDLLFLRSCSSKDGEMEYRVLRADGKLLLRELSDPLQADHEAVGNERSRTFAVKVVRSKRWILPDAVFRSSDLDSAEVRVYRADDGKRLLAVLVREPEAIRGGYALSPDGAQLAVLSRSEIEFFPVPAK